MGTDFEDELDGWEDDGDWEIINGCFVPVEIEDKD